MSIHCTLKLTFNVSNIHSYSHTDLNHRLNKANVTKFFFIANRISQSWAKKANYEFCNEGQTKCKINQFQVLITSTKSWLFLPWNRWSDPKMMMMLQENFYRNWRNFFVTSKSKSQQCFSKCLIQKNFNFWKKNSN